MQYLSRPFLPLRLCLALVTALAACDPGPSGGTPDEPPAPDKPDARMTPRATNPMPMPGKSQDPAATPSSSADASVAADGRAPATTSDARTPDATATTSVDGGTKPPSVVTLPAPGAAGILPVLHIETGGKSIPGTKSEMIAATLKIITDHDGNFDGKDPKAVLARPVSAQHTIGINRHGNASDQFVPMKAYNVELRDAAGMDNSEPILGMPKGSDWLLFACYIDKTCMKNMLAYTLFREMGWWASRGRFVEVVIDGKYNGLYVLFEKIRRDNERVNIPKVGGGPQDPPGSDVTGGYIYKCDSPSDGAAYDWKTAGGYTLSYVRPKHDAITAEQKTYIQKHTNDFDRVMMGPGYADPNTGYRAWIDVKSWIDYLFIDELSNNADGLIRSAFFYKTSKALGGKIFAGPTWDYDLAFSTDLRGHDRTDVWQHQHSLETLLKDNGHSANRNILNVWGKLFKEPGFQRDMKCRWNELGKATLGTAAINAKIDGWAKDLGPASKRHFVRWPIIGVQIFGNGHFIGKTWDEDISHLKSWVAKRLTWMNANMPGTCAAP